MVIFSASIVSKKRILVSRQFVEMSRGDVENYLNTFIKRIEQYCLSNEYTYMEFGDIRYVYQVLDNIYMILMTPLSSNIIEDMDTLRLFCQVLYDCCDNPPPLTEDLIISNCFEIIFAFDEIISFGYKESVNLAQIKTCLEMESQEEKLHKMIRQNKENEERERRRHIANKLDKERSAHETYNNSISSGANVNSNIVRSSLSGIAAFAESVGVGKFAQSVGISSNKIYVKNDHSSSNADNQNCQNTSFGIYGNMIGNTYSMSAPTKGMLIGKKKLALEVQRQQSSQENSDSDIFKTQISDPKINLPSHLDLTEDKNSLIEEKLELLMSTDGVIQSKIDIQGTFQITLETDKFPEYSIIEDSRFQFKAHPNLNKEKYQNSGVLVLKDGLKTTFPKNTFMPLVKWRSSFISQTPDFKLPFFFTCWPMDSGNGSVGVTIEVESIETITNIRIQIPINNVSAYNASTGTIDSEENYYIWNIAQIVSNETALLEFTTTQDFLPIKLTVSSTQKFCNLGVKKNGVSIRPASNLSTFYLTVNK